jgi:Leucine-rich repeat (LRR) protein
LGHDLKHISTLRINAARGGLGGPLPSFAGLVNVEELELASNAFSGTIPVDFLKKRHHDGRLKVRLSGNQLVGEIPVELSVFSSLLLELENNQITSIPDSLCENHPDWMDGELGRMESSSRPCDAILCPSGYWSPYGRTNATMGITTCEPCEDSLFFGATTCKSKNLERNVEVDILDKLFEETGGRNWRMNTNWTRDDVPICLREGVICGWKPNDMNSGVTELHLDGFGLSGKIPTEIFQLPKIRLLSFSTNHIDLSFDGIEQAELLEVLSLGNTAVGTMEGIEKAGEKLSYITMSGSSFKGAFPSELFSLGNLKAVNLDDNQITGVFPTELCQLSSLEIVSLSNNRLFGNIPTELGHLISLKSLRLAQNLFTGLLPLELESLSLLEQIDLSGQKSENRLVGTMLSFSSNIHLQKFNMSWNAFSGYVPSNLLSSVDKTASINVDLSNNAFTGSFPLEFQSFEQLDIQLEGNLIDDLSTEICDNPLWMHGITNLVEEAQKCDSILCKPGSFSHRGKQAHITEPCKKCSSADQAPYFGSTECMDSSMRLQQESKFRKIDCLWCITVAQHLLSALLAFAEAFGVEHWYEREYWLSDRHVCTWYGVICKGSKVVTGLRLEDNNLQDSNEEADALEILTRMPHLTMLGLDRNNIKINLQSISSNSPLGSLSVSYTKTRTLDGISSAKSLYCLVAMGNGLAGKLPSETFDARGLQELHLSNNKFSGEIPSALFSLPTLEKLSLDNNMFAKQLPTEIGSLSTIQDLLLSENWLTGSIPSEILKLTNLERLAIDNQKGEEKISGRIPNFSKSSRIW